MTNVLAFPLVFRVLLVVIGAVAAAAPLVLFSHTSEAQQQVAVRITALSCDANPETITVENYGTTDVAMTGWNLQSDPTTQESLALAQFGVLAAGESVMVQSGPAASGPLAWSQQELFRNGDATDFVQLASDEGFVLAKMNCQAGQATAGATVGATPAATPARTAAPAQTAAPAATVASAAAAPVGGGPPGAAAGSIVPVLMMIFGSGMLSAGLATFAFPLLRRRGEADGTDAALPLATTDASEAFRNVPPAGSAARPRAAVDQSRESEDSLRMFLAVLVVILAGVAMLAYLLQGSENRRE